MEKKDKQTGETKKKQDQKLLYKILLAVFAAALVLVAGILIKNRITEKHAEQKYEELSAQASQEGPEGKEDENGKEGQEPGPEGETLQTLQGIEIPGKNLDWEGLKKENEDIYGWVYIPGTQVDYPLLQHPTDDSYYLVHNLDGSEGYPGCIYTESRNKKDFTDPNTILYGHNMKDGSMFGSLHNFEEASFFEGHRYAFLYTEEQTFVYDLFAAYEFSDDHLLYAYDFTTEKGYQEYLDMVFEIRDMGAHFREGTEVTAEDKILTMSTCISTKPENRYLVQGVLVGSVEAKNSPERKEVEKDAETDTGRE